MSSAASYLQRAARLVARVPAAVLVGVIRVYQRTLGPALPVITMGRCGCRFHPTCSHYAAAAIATHGALTGTRLAVTRLAKCTPLHPGGFDPVPAAPMPQRVPPSCARATPSFPQSFTPSQS